MSVLLITFTCCVVYQKVVWCTNLHKVYKLTVHRVGFPHQHLPRVIPPCLPASWHLCPVQVNHTTFCASAGEFFFFHFVWHADNRITSSSLSLYMTCFACFLLYFLCVVQTNRPQYESSNWPWHATSVYLSGTQTGRGRQAILGDAWRQKKKLM